MINAHDSIFVRRHGKPTTYYNGSFHNSLTESHDRYKTEVIEPKGTPGTAFQIEFETDSWVVWYNQMSLYFYRRDLQLAAFQRVYHARLVETKQVS